MGLKTNAFVVIFAISVLMFSGNSIASSMNGGAGGVASTAGSVGHAPTYTGPASKVLLGGPLVGPARATPMAVSAIPGGASSLLSGHSLQLPPSPNPRPALTHSVSGAAALVAGPLVVPPVVSCQPRGASCDAISGNNGGVTADRYGLNAQDNDASYGATVEPPDQAVCAGAGYVMEVLNIGIVRVTNTTFGNSAADVTLDSLMGLTTLGWSSGGDISCLYDANNGGHWFVTEFVSRSSEASGGTFAGCFAGVLDGCLEGIAVSVTSNPTGSYNVYFLDPNTVNSDPGAGYLLNDFAKIGNTRDALLVFYDEFNQNGSTIPACPAYGCFGFNGAQEFAFDKKALELGWPVLEPFGGADPYLTVAYENMGTDPGIVPPDGACFTGPTAGADCWYQVIPAQSPLPSQFDNSHDGSGFMLGALDFFGAGDNRIAVFDWSGLSHLNSYNCGTCSALHFGGEILTGLLAYQDEGAGCLASAGGFCGLGPQRAGTIPLGDNCVAFGLTGGSSKCPENGIASNGDGFTQVSYSQGNIWGAVSTLVVQQYGSSGNCTTGPATCETHIGAAFWAIGTSGYDSHAHGGHFAVTTQGYATARHEDMEFPAIAASGTDGTALLSFTLNGDGGPTHADHGGYFPSSAFAWLSTTTGGVVGGIMHVADRGRGAQDGFSEYQGYPGGTRPRWGDYGEAIYSPAMGGGFYFASEYIQSPNCSAGSFLIDPSCGGTRAPFANWGSSLNWVA